MTYLTMQTPVEMRIDKWLWAVRLYRSRSAATEACQGGHVKIAGQSVKPARTVRGGEVITALTGGVNRSVKVLALLERRVGARLVAQYLEDLTSPDEYERARRDRESAPAAAPKGWGRPTKKVRRQWEGLWGPGGP